MLSAPSLASIPLPSIPFRSLPSALLPARICRLFSLAVLLCLALPASAQTDTLRIGAWNITDYNGGRVSDFQTALYGSYNGRSFAPDVLVGEEFVSVSGAGSFLTILNTAQGSPGDWKAAPYISGPDTNCELFYRAGKVTYLNTVTVNPTTGVTDQPRNTYRYDLKIGTGADAPLLDIYAVHLKSDNTATDQARRLIETNRIRANADTLNANPLHPPVNFMVAGDYNIQSSAEASYQALVGAQANNLGRFYDPIASPGTWRDNAADKFLDTQDPTSQMDDRYDQILMSQSLFDGKSLDYIGDPTRPFSTTTWNDPNHSYRVWGNDGTGFNGQLTIAGNLEVGQAIAQALFNTVGTTNFVANGGTGGHLPVYADFRILTAVVPETSGACVPSIGFVVLIAFYFSRKRLGRSQPCPSVLRLSTLP